MNKLYPDARIALADVLKDGMTLSGFIALQVHGNKQQGLEVGWRNIRIQELPGGSATLPVALGNVRMAGPN